MSSAAALRALLREKKTIFTVGIGDALQARIADETPGIDAVLSSGFSIAAQFCGLPDADLYTRSDNVYAVQNMCYGMKKPVIADIDTGYGNAVTVMRSVREFERAGAAAIILEDQVSPKKCPICVANVNTVIPAEEAAGKIRAAVDARLNPETVVIARCDATDRDELMRRCRMYIEAGADLVQPISRTFSTKDEYKAFVKEVNHPVSMIIVGWLEKLTREEILDIGPAIAQFAIVPVNVAYEAVRLAMEHLGAQHSVTGLPVPQANHQAFLKTLGMPEILALEEKYLPQE